MPQTHYLSKPGGGLGGVAYKDWAQPPPRGVRVIAAGNMRPLPRLLQTLCLLDKALWCKRLHRLTGQFLCSKQYGGPKADWAGRRRGKRRNCDCQSLRPTKGAPPFAGPNAVSRNLHLRAFSGDSCDGGGQTSVDDRPTLTPRARTLCTSGCFCTSSGTQTGGGGVAGGDLAPMNSISGEGLTVGNLAAGPRNSVETAVVHVAEGPSPTHTSGAALYAGETQQPHGQ